MAVARIGFNAPTAGGNGAPPVGDMPASPGPGGGTRVEVDLDEAPKLIEALSEAVKQLTAAYNDSALLRTITPPGKDPYSVQAASIIQESASDSPGGYGWANKEARAALTKTIANIEKSMADYQQTDASAIKTN